MELQQNHRNNKEHTRRGPKRNLCCRVPAIKGAAERDGHDEECRAGEKDKRHWPVHVPELLLGEQLGLRVERGKEEEICWGKYSPDDEVDVESLDN